MTALPQIAPMLASAGHLPPPSAEDRWAVEVKQDGQRAIVRLPGDGTVALLSRKGLAITPAYPELHTLGEAFGDMSAVLDGEIIVPDEQGHADFERLQSRMGLGRSPAAAARLASATPAHLITGVRTGSPCASARVVRRHQQISDPCSGCHPRA